MFTRILFFLSLFLFSYAEESEVAKISEAMGHIIGKNLEALGLELDMDAIVKGLKEESEGKSSPLNEDECVQAIADLQEKKMSAANAEELEHADAISNGDLIEDEDHSIPASDSPKYR